MKNIPAVNCTRPMCYSVPNTDCPYNIGGTCFVVRFRQRLWAFTAKHILTNLGVSPNQVMIPYIVGGYHFFNLSDARTFENYPTDSDCTDIVLFEIDENTLDMKHYDESTVYDLDSEPDFPITGDMLLAVHGFPDELNKINDEGTALIMQRASISGHFGDRSQMTGCREIDLLGNGNLKSHSGFSGCPIFIASSEFNQPNASKLIGINLRGTTSKKHYLDIIALKKLVDVHLANQITEQGGAANPLQPSASGDC
ncbi:MAG: hypothetical protein HC904_16950 [Blastochloris sp.]|nr:hypothetical protein [Blastochloris sp.]